jgi:sialic acid synthase SpsE
MKKPYIIAEIGVNYYDIAKQNNISLMVAAKLMVKEAKESGANAVKFQSYKAGKIASKNSPSYWDLSKETTNNQFELFKKYDKFGELEYIEICDYCKEIGIDFMSTPFDLDSIDYLDKLVKTHKISSSDITNYPLLKKISKTGKKILLSTGASNLEEVKKAVQVIENEGNRDIVLLHCILNYPTLNNNAHLNMIKDLKKLGYEVGYSDHTLPDEGMLVLSTAVTMGATWIEKHFTLDKTLPGNDHYHAMDSNDLKKFSNNLKLLGEIMGEEFKHSIPTEEISRLNARRSVYVNTDLAKGKILREENLICKRPANGVCASSFEDLIGKRLNQNIKKDTSIQWNIIE